MVKFEDFDYTNDFEDDFEEEEDNDDFNANDLLDFTDYQNKRKQSTTVTTQP